MTIIVYLTSSGHSRFVNIHTETVLLNTGVNSSYNNLTKVQSLHPRNNTTSETSRPPAQHVFYLKTHKTGSGSIFSILSEYCRSHDLSPLLPKGLHFGRYTPFDPDQLDLSQPEVGRAMAFHHMVFRPQVMDYLPQDTFR